MTDLVLEVLGMLPWWAKILLALAVAGVALLQSLRFVNEAEQGLRLRWGRVVRNKDKEPIILEPGFILIIPVVENLVKHHTREQPLTLEDQKIILKDKSVFEVGAAVYFRIHNVYRAMFDISNVELALKNYCMGVLRDILQELENADGLDTKALSETIFADVQAKAEEWGLEITAFKIMNCAPTAETSSFLNAGAAVTARKQALDEAGVTDAYLAAALLGAQAVNTVSQSSE